MNQFLFAPDEHGAPAQVLELDQICLQFEAAWQKATSVATGPRLEDYLPDVPWRRLLVRELLALDLAYRVQAGDPARPEDYRARLANLVTDFDGLVRELGSSVNSPYTEMLTLQSLPHKKNPNATQVVDEPPPSPDEVDATHRGQQKHFAGLGETLSGAPVPASGTVDRPTIDGQSTGAVVQGSGGIPKIQGYQILSVLGHGGMGVVYKAQDLELKRLVALKMILAGAHAPKATLARFRIEAEAIAQLTHPNIVQIYAIGEQNGCPFISLELVEGGSLSQRLAGDPIPVREAALLLEKIAHGMDAAHERGVIHRDLKPGNILLTPAGEPKISDFGLAKQLHDHSGQTQSGEILGTPSYMAPEQAGGEIRKIGPATDVYALGAILYHLLVGRPPFRAETPVELLMLAVNDDPVPLSRLQPKVPRDLETICLKCLEKEPAKRYVSAAELAGDLHRFLVDEPILARPASIWERGRKWAKRRPTAAAVLAMAAACVLGLFAFNLWSNVRLRDAVTLAKAEVRDTTAAMRQLENRARIQDWLNRGYVALAAQDWRMAITDYDEVLARQDADAELAELFDQAQRQRAVAQAKWDEQQAVQQVQKRLDEFRHLRDDVVFYGSLSTGEELPANLDKSRAAAQKALALFGVAVEGPGQPHWDKHLEPGERAEAAEGAYELLLIWAESLAAPLPGQGAQEHRHQLERALALLQRAHDLGPASQAYYLRQARYLRELGQEAEAARAQARAAAGRPVTAADYFLAGDEFFRQENTAQAIRDFENATYQDPKHFWARYYLAIGYLKQQRWLEARLTFGVCLRERSFLWAQLLRGVAAGRSGDLPAAEMDFEKVLEELARHPNTEIAYGLYINRGAIRQLARKTEAAVADFLRARELAPAKYQAPLSLARVYWSKKSWEQALKYLDEAIQRQPAFASLRRDLAAMHADRGDWDAAKRDIATALALHAQQPATASTEWLTTYLLSGRILLRSGHHAAAVVAYEQALRLPLPTVPPELHRAHGDALFAAQRYDKALAAYNRYLERATPTAEDFQARALVHEKLGHYGPELDDLSESLRLKRKVSTLTQRAWLYLLAFRSPALALPDFDAALQLEPRDSKKHAGRGYALVKLGQREEAVRAVQRALELGLADQQSLTLAARTFAQAAALLAADRKMAALFANDRRVHEERAVVCLAKAFELPQAKRPALWDELRHHDFDAIRAGNAFRGLELRFGGLAKNAP
jgi:serine/threonine protein kinase/Tfp pilus assembly protein PilF